MSEHMAQFGLECKDPEWLEDGTLVLGLVVTIEQGELRWRQGSIVPNALDVVMQRTVFSLCGRLVEHLLVCGWLRVACRILKKRASLVMKRWDDKIGTPSSSAWCLIQ